MTKAGEFVCSWIFRIVGLAVGRWLVVKNLTADGERIGSCERIRGKSRLKVCATPMIRGGVASTLEA
jgi:hypothetical protein